ncbi:hypothetical protein PROFUN_00150 [Planoprotostelium fungivorum]|uniref:Uncharacterized protein n=1 Tax=Planoprotostelium fungivorum TaxID=1890364 RepID=A0A2P6P0U2_9EUKA|nr:hypothetical protein PROFUN_00150 [Planoprotostelium fungivorum]
MPFGERTVDYVALQKQHLSFILRPATTRATTTTYTHEQPLTEVWTRYPLHLTQDDLSSTTASSDSAWPSVSTFRTRLLFASATHESTSSIDHLHITDRVEQMQEDDGRETREGCAPLPHQTIAVSSSLFSLTSQRDRRKTVELSVTVVASERQRQIPSDSPTTLAVLCRLHYYRCLCKAGGTAQSQASDVFSDRSVCLFLYGEEQRDEGTASGLLFLSLYLFPLLDFSFDLS